MFRIHRRTGERGIERIVASDLVPDGDITRCKVDPPREEQRVIVGETTMDSGVHEIPNGPVNRAKHEWLLK